MQGFVYVLTNPSMPNIVKIGKTTRLPTDRAGELFTTGVPTPFVIEFAVLVKNACEAERVAHEVLEAKRVSDSREFFQVPVECAVKAICNYHFEDRFNLNVVECEMSISEAEWHWLSHKCGVHPFELEDVIEQISDNEWNAAAARYAEDKEICKLETELNDVGFVI